MLKAKIMFHLFLVIISKIKKGFVEGLMLISGNPKIRILLPVGSRLMLEK